MKVLPVDYKGSSSGVFLCAVKYILYTLEEGSAESRCFLDDPRCIVCVHRVTLHRGHRRQESIHQGWILLLSVTLEVMRFCLFLLPPSSGTRGQSRHFPLLFCDSFLPDHGQGGRFLFSFVWGWDVFGFSSPLF